MFIYMMIVQMLIKSNFLLYKMVSFNILGAIFRRFAMNLNL